MDAQARTKKRTLRVQRAFERSRLEDAIVAAAYELAVPAPRRSRRTTRYCDDHVPLPCPQARSSGGSSA